MNRTPIALPRVQRTLLLVLALTVVESLFADTAKYFYDEVGRLLGVADSTGVTAIYNYDAVGNLSSIQKFTPPGSGIGIYLTAPGSGPATTQVTIQGYGFDPTPAKNTVEFDGTAVTVTSATDHTLIVALPNAATTGSVTVTNATLSLQLRRIGISS